MNNTRADSVFSHIDVRFARASIATSLIIFREELDANFARWERLPSLDLRFGIIAWRKLGKLAIDAFQESIVSQYSNLGFLDALTPDLSRIRDDLLFLRWKTLVAENRRECGAAKQSSKSGAANHGRSKLLVRIDHCLEDRVGCRLNGKGPVAQLQTGGFLYLTANGREPVNIGVAFCRSNTDEPLKGHNGLNSAVSIDLLPDSDEIAGFVADEIVRYLEILRIQIPSSGIK